MNAVDKEGRTVLLLAGARGSWRSVMVLIRLKANVICHDNCQRNILHHIVISGGNLTQFTNEIAHVNEKFQIQFDFIYFYVCRRIQLNTC